MVLTNLESRSNLFLTFFSRYIYAIAGGALHRASYMSSETESVLPTVKTYAIDNEGKR